MPCTIMNRHVQMLLQESNTAFNMLLEAGGAPNTDYADYTAQTRINCFRSALQNPELSRAELAGMMRRALRKQVSRKSQNTYWSAFMASYVSRNANSNDIFK